MSKKCIKCGEILPDDASFCPHCTTVQTEKKEIKTPRKWRKKAVIGVAVLAVAAVIGIAFLSITDQKHMKAVLRSLIRIRENHTKFC